MLPNPGSLPNNLGKVVKNKKQITKFSDVTEVSYALRFWFDKDYARTDLRFDSFYIYLRLLNILSFNSKSITNSKNHCHQDLRMFFKY